MRKKTIFILLIFLFLQQSVMPTILLDDGEVFTHLSSPDSSMVTASVASEEENVDTFEVYPSSRWSETNFGSVSVSISDNMLNMTDQGGGTISYYHISRGLGKLDSKIEVLFKVDTDNEGAAHVNDRFRVHLYSVGYQTDAAIFEVRPRNGSSCQTYLNYYGVSGLQSKNLTGSERCYDNLWYKLRIDYNILKSTVRFRLTYENETRLFDYNYYEISSDRPKLFSATDLTVRIYGSMITTDKNFEYLVDYIKAPFKEREWRQTDTPSDPQWEQDYWYICKLDGPVVDTSNFTLDVPYLDTYSGKVTYWEQGGIDEGIFYNVLYAVTPSDGTLVRIGYIEFGITGQDFWLIIYDPTDGTTIIDFATETVANAENPLYHYSIGLSEDRSIVTTRIRIYWVGEDTTDPDFIDVLYKYDIGNSYSEFLIEHCFDFDYDEDKEISIIIDDFGIVERNIFADWIFQTIMGITSDSSNWLGGLFIALFRFIADIFKGVGEVITGVLGPIIKALEPFLTAITDALSPIFDTIGLIWTEFSTFVTDIIDQLVLMAGDFVDECIKFLLSTVSQCVDLGADILFYVWDALGLPDLLAILDTLLTSIFETITAVPQAIIDLMDFFVPLFIVILAFYWFWLIFLAFAEEGFDPFAGLANTIGRLFATVPIPVPLVGSIPFPIALFFIPLTYFLVLPPESVFAIW